MNPTKILSIRKASLGMLLAGSSALAASLPAAASDALSAAPAGIVWTGGYVSVHAGYSWGDATVFYEDTLDGGLADGYAALAPRGAIAGFYVGYGHQFANNVVPGVETDLFVGAGSTSKWRRRRKF